MTKKELAAVHKAKIAGLHKKKKAIDLELARLARDEAANPERGAISRLHRRKTQAQRLYSIGHRLEEQEAALAALKG